MHSLNAKPRLAAVGKERRAEAETTGYLRASTSPARHFRKLSPFPCSCRRQGCVWEILIPPPSCVRCVAVGVIGCSPPCGVGVEILLLVVADIHGPDFAEGRSRRRACVLPSHRHTCGCWFLVAIRLAPLWRALARMPPGGSPGCFSRTLQGHPLEHPLKRLGEPLSDAVRLDCAPDDATARLLLLPG